MMIDDEEPDEDRIIKKRKGFSYYPLYTYKRNLDKTFTTSTLNHILMIKED